MLLVLLTERNVLFLSHHPYHLHELSLLVGFLLPQMINIKAVFVRGPVEIITIAHVVRWNNGTEFWGKLSKIT